MKYKGYLIFGFVHVSTAEDTCYSKYSKMSNTFLFLFVNKLLVIGAGMYNTLVRIPNREDHGQTASSEAV